eukprot:scaffold1822_cov333-Pavlova_lutheri.AAC.13
MFVWNQLDCSVPTLLAGSTWKRPFRPWPWLSCRHNSTLPPLQTRTRLPALKSRPLPPRRSCFRRRTCPPSRRSKCVEFERNCPSFANCRLNTRLNSGMGRTTVEGRSSVDSCNTHANA